jgi:hypothetical protein
MGRTEAIPDASIAKETIRGRWIYIGGPGLKSTDRPSFVAHLEHEEIADDRLRLIFTCCHPALPPEGQAALTLREICGLTWRKKMQ